jgi:transposase
MDDAERRAAKARLVEGMLNGQAWEAAVRASGLDLRRSAAYRLTQRVCAYGNEALADHRHGHVSKMHAPVRQWLEAYCRGAPGTPSRMVQAALWEQFGLAVSITHLNRVRASLGIGRRVGRGGKEGPAGGAGPTREPLGT